MGKLVLLYWGTVFLMYLSDRYYPDGDRYNKVHHGNFMRDRMDVFLLIIVVWLTAFSFLRTSYNDTDNYIMEWNNATVSLDEFLDSGELLKLGSNPLYDLYRTLVHEFTDNYHFFFFVPALVSSVGAVKLFKRYSVDPVFSLLVFHSIGTYIMYMAAMKQGIAIAILLLAIPYAIDGKYAKYYLLVFLAMMFHTHAFIFLAVPFYFEKPWGKITWVLFAVVLVAMVTYDTTFGAFMNFALSLGINVADIEVFDGHAIHPIRVLVYAVPAIVSFIFRYRLYWDSNREENLFANMSISAVMILMIGLIQGANLFARMAAYYEIALSLSFPWMVRKIFNERSARLITALAYICFFGYFLYEFGISKDFGGNYRAIPFWQFVRSLMGQ